MVAGPASPASHGLPEIRIHYLRPPDRRTVYRQWLVHESPTVKITLARGLELDAPLLFQGKVGLEAGSDAVWFTFPGAWHDIGRFYRADGTLTGIYANTITPCTFEAGGRWDTTDLFLDLWLPAQAPGAATPGAPPTPVLLDEDELEAAEAAGHISPRHAARARAEVRRLMALAADHAWPPPMVWEWTRDRALGLLEASRPR